MMTDEDIKRLNEENRKLKKRAEEAEGEVTIVKGIGQNSPEMRALQKEVEELKAEGNASKKPLSTSLGLCSTHCGGFLFEIQVA